MSDSMYEFALRNKMRFTSNKGLISLEALWELPLRSKDGFNLDSVAKATNIKLKEAGETSFVDTGRNAAQISAEAEMAIVKHVISVKLTEEAANKLAAENKVKKARLLEILAEKQQGALSALSEAEIRAQLEALG